MSEKLLDKINYPSDLRLLKRNQLKKVSEELRSELINVVSETGGHLGASLGVIELTVAISVMIPVNIPEHISLKYH